MNNIKLPTKIAALILLYNKFLIAGIFVFGISLFLFIGFSKNLDIHAYKYRINNTSKVIGIRKATFETNVNLNENKIYEYSYEFNIDGEKYQNSSYEKNINLPKPLKIEYLTKSPNISRIIGLRNAAFPFTAIFIIIPFVLIGFLLLFIPIKKSYQFIKVLENNFIHVNGRLIKKWTIPFLRFNGMQSLYKFRFEYQINQKTYNITLNNTDFNKYNENDELMIIVNEKNPSKGFLVQHYSKSVVQYIQNKILLSTPTQK